MKRIKLLLSLTATLFFILTAFAQQPDAAVSAITYEKVYEAPTTYRDFRFAVGGGYAYRLGKMQKTGDQKIDDLNKQLRHNVTIDADAQYFFKEGWGLGLNANYCLGNASGSQIYMPDIGETIDNYKETQNMLFIGPSFAGRNEFEKFVIVSSIALGPLFYTSKMSFDGASLSGNKTTLGLNAGLSGEYKLNGKTGVGVKLSYTVGTIESMNIGGQSIDLGEKMSISNFMATAFLSFRSW